MSSLSRFKGAWQRVFSSSDSPTTNEEPTGTPNITREIRKISPRPVAFGGYSDIYTGIWRSATGEMKVAIKVIRAVPMNNESTKMPRALRREISVWKRLRHRNIHILCGLYEGIGPVPALVSPWCANGDIKNYLERHVGSPDIELLKLRMLGDIMCGLKFLHSNSIVHGDIKGQNVLISDAGVARLRNFGLSRLLAENSQSVTYSGVRGASRWMAPEIFLDGERQSYASDMWACGCLFIEVWNDVLPYRTKVNDLQFILALQEKELPGSQLEMPDMIWTLVRECCNFDAAQRPSSLQIATRISHHLLRKRRYPHTRTSRAPFDANPQEQPTVAATSVATLLIDLDYLDISDNLSDVSSVRVAGGGYADVHTGKWKFTNISEELQVAVKIVRKLDHEVNLKIAERWRKEIFTWVDLSHDNVLPLIGLCWTPWPGGSTLLLPATISPWCPFGNINQYLKLRPATALRKLQLLSEILMGLGYLHHKGIVHADVKGDNILVSENETALISDFGLSALFAEHLAFTHTAVGTSRWMAPELFHEHARATSFSDMWAIGCVIYETVTGQPPYPTLRTDGQVVVFIEKGNHPLRPDRFPDKFWELSTQCWQNIPKDRPTTTLLLQQVQTLLEYSESELQRGAPESYDLVGQQKRSYA